MSDTAPQGSGKTVCLGDAQLPPGKLIIFALGQLGWSLAAYGVGNLVAYFYMPPETVAAPVFPPFIFQGAVGGVFTIVGIITFLGRAFQSVTSPLAASWSDRSHARLGRRRFFMLISAVPFSIFSCLVFLPLRHFSAPPNLSAGWPNAAWLGVTILLFYLFFSMYTMPYDALISELGHTPRERLRISASVSVTWALGFGLGTQIYMLQGILERSGWGAVSAFQAVQVTLSGFSLLLMLLPVAFIDERRHGVASISRLGAFRSLAVTLRNRNFLRLILTELLYFACQTMIQVGLVYYVVTLLHLDKSVMSGLLPLMFVFSFAFYYPVIRAAARFEKKRVLLAGLCLLDALFLLISLMGRLPLPGLACAAVLALFASAPMAILGIIPNAIVADVAEADRLDTGDSRAAMFYGIRAFTDNLGIAIGDLLLASFLTLGKSVEHPLGVQVSAVVALFVSIAATAVFATYDEEAVHRSLEARKTLPKGDVVRVADLP